MSARPFRAGYFYPRSPCGERPALAWASVTLCGFLSTLSLRRATCGILLRCVCTLYFYPRSPCGERHGWYMNDNNSSDISIHALLAESDGTSTDHHPTSILISIHALLAESDPRRYYHRPHLGYFYPRSPCGERRGTGACRRGTLRISIHALLAESDLRMPSTKSTLPVFLSTLSLRRATGQIERRGADPRHFYPRSPCGERPD